MRLLFFLWPSCGGIDSDTSIIDLITQSLSLFNGIGCKFEEAYKNAEIAGEILSSINGCKFFLEMLKLISSDIV